MSLCVDRPGVFCCSLTRVDSISQPHAVSDFDINLSFPVSFRAVDRTVFLSGHVVAVDFAANGWLALYRTRRVYLV